MAHAYTVAQAEQRREIERIAIDVRRAGCAGAPPGSISLTEMLPQVDQAWLADREGERYTCELRIAALAPDDDRR